MEVKTITYQRVKNLGNYESERLEMTVESDEFESPTEVALNLKEMVLEVLDIEEKIKVKEVKESSADFSW